MIESQKPIAFLTNDPDLSDAERMATNITKFEVCSVATGIGWSQPGSPRTPFQAATPVRCRGDSFQRGIGETSRDCSRKRAPGDRGRAPRAGTNRASQSEPGGHFRSGFAHDSGSGRKGESRRRGRRGMRYLCLDQRLGRARGGRRAKRGRLEIGLSAGNAFCPCRLAHVCRSAGDPKVPDISRRRSGDLSS